MRSLALAEGRLGLCPRCDRLRDWPRRTFPCPYCSFPVQNSDMGQGQHSAVGSESCPSGEYLVSNSQRLAGSSGPLSKKTQMDGAGWNGSGSSRSGCKHQAKGTLYLRPLPSNWPVPSSKSHQHP